MNQSEGSADHAEQVFRPPRGLRVLFLCILVPIGLITLIMTAGVVFSSWSDRSGTLAALVMVLAPGLATVWLCLLGLRVRIVADEEGVEVVNMLSQRRFRWAEIEGIGFSQSRGIGPLATYQLVIRTSRGAFRCSLQSKDAREVRRGIPTTADTVENALNELRSAGIFGSS